jgi:hypothetical protein
MAGYQVFHSPALNKLGAVANLDVHVGLMLAVRKTKGSLWLPGCSDVGSYLDLKQIRRKLRQLPMFNSVWFL